VVDIIQELQSYAINVTVYDPWADPEEVKKEYEVDTIRQLSDNGQYDAIVLAVAHKEFNGSDWKKLLKKGGIIYDVKGHLDKQIVDSRL
jgi:UDP-N-acetyl-D-galactosamine dehydrogenase